MSARSALTQLFPCADGHLEFISDEEFLKELQDLEGDQGPGDDDPPLQELTDDQWKKAFLNECALYGELRLLSDPHDVVEKWFRPLRETDPSTADLLFHFEGDATELPVRTASQLGLSKGAAYGDAAKQITVIYEWVSNCAFRVRKRARAAYREEQQRLDDDCRRCASDDESCANWREEGF